MIYSKFIVKSLLVFGCYCLFFAAHAQNNQHKQLEKDTFNIELLQVVATRPTTLATERMPITATNLTAKQIQEKNFGQDIPFLLRTTPSVVETSDAGAGVGYTALRIRGSDLTRINVTIDGIPINDAESQLVYWVNMPDIASSTNLIQIQRGVGTSTNGAGAFGATLNLVTNAQLQQPNLLYSGGFGSFNTQKHSLSASSGIFAKNFYVEGRLSNITSDGYIERAKARLRSWYLSGVWFDDRSSLKLKAFGGAERTYQAWYGVPAQLLETNRRYNPAGREKAGEPYENEVDDYAQTHLHALFNHRFAKNWQANIALHYTNGKGFYEQYKAGQILANYFDGSPNDTTDLIRQLWLANDFYGAIFSLTHKTKRAEMVLGAAWNNYVGQHFGTVEQLVTLNRPVTDYKADREFYRTSGLKNDVNVYLKTTYQFNKWLNGFLDVQYRHVAYLLAGVDRRRRLLDRDLRFDFFNPKIGFTFEPTEGGRMYASFAIANREPNRNDFTDMPLHTSPQPERLQNVEVGWQKNWKNWAWSSNFFFMNYNNQLAVTGQINDVGEQIRANIPHSYRVGVEMEARWKLSDWQLSSNLTWSKNKIADFTEYIDNWDTWTQDTFLRGTTDLAFSPDVIANIEIGKTILDSPEKWYGNLLVSIGTKYVGRQFIDNTANEQTALAAYSQTDLKVIWNLKLKQLKTMQLKLLINNIFNQQFVNNAWTYRFSSPSYDPRPDNNHVRLEHAQNNIYNMTGFFPQAGTNFLFGLTVGF